MDSVTGDVNVSMVTVGMVQWTGLHPYHTYKYRVAAATAVGLGPFSEERTVQTSEAGVILLIHYCECLLTFYLSLLPPQHRPFPLSM